MALVGLSWIGAGGQAWHSWIAGAVEGFAPATLDDLAGSERFFCANVVAQRLQRGGQPVARILLESHPIGFPLVMKPWLGQGLGRRHSVVERVEESEEYLRDDGRASGRTNAHGGHAV